MNKQTLNWGLEDLVVAKVLSDTNEGIEYGEVEHFMLASTMTSTTESEVKSISLDNSSHFTRLVTGSDTVTITGTVPPLKLLAEINGNIYDESLDGIVGSTGATPQYALGFKTKNITADSSEPIERYYWILKGAFGVVDDNFRTSDKDGDPELTSIEFKSERTVHRFTRTGSGEKRIIVNAANLENPDLFFKTVITPDTVGDLAKQ